METVTYENKILTLTQNAYPLTETVWTALAKDEDDNMYEIFWDEYEDFDGDDFSNACDWDKYCVSKIGQTL